VLNATIEATRSGEAGNGFAFGIGGQIARLGIPRPQPKRSQAISDTSGQRRSFDRNLLVSRCHDGARSSFRYSAAVAVADLEVSVGLICWACGRAAGLSLSRMAWNVT
jgi:hypothetical protein